MRVTIFRATSSMGKKLATGFSFQPIANSIPGDSLEELEVEVPDGWTVDVERDRLVRSSPSGNLEARRVHALAAAKTDGFSLVGDAV